MPFLTAPNSTNSYNVRKRGILPGDLGSTQSSRNVAELSQLFDDVVSRKITDPIYFPGGDFAFNDELVIPKVQGGKIRTAGGITFNREADDLFDNHLIAGSCTRLIYTGTRTGTHHFIRYHGYGWDIEPITLHAYPVTNHNTWCNSQFRSAPGDVGYDATTFDNLPAATDTTQITTGILLEKPDENFPTGGLRLQGLTAVGFESAVHSTDALEDDQTDNLFIDRLDIIGCDNGIVIDNNLGSVHNTIGAIYNSGHCDYMIKNLKGGIIKVNTCGMLLGGTIYYAGPSGPNKEWTEINCVRVDNKAIAYDAIQNPGGTPGGKQGPPFKLIEVASDCILGCVNMSGNVNHGHALGGYVDDPVVKLPNNWRAEVVDGQANIYDALSGGNFRATIRLDFVGISPTTRALYPR
jgi:hypothetical protein